MHLQTISLFSFFFQVNIDDFQRQQRHTSKSSMNALSEGVNKEAFSVKIIKHFVVDGLSIELQ